MTRKLRILWLGEASFLNTGYAVYTKEVLDRLYDTNKYDIAELGVYGEMVDDRRFTIPWRYYGNMPDTPDENDAYKSVGINQFGCWKFEDTCLDFKPDVVCDPRDWWMGEFVERSPFRRFINWAIMPTIDSIPQPEQWLATYMDADGVFAYSEFGRDYLLQECGNLINFQDLAPPAANYKVLAPVPNKIEHRREYGFQDNIFIVGTVMRNQKRKLYPDLIESFAKMLKEHPEIGKKTYLYLHTSYPDSGWDIPKLVKEAGIGHKTLFTYICARQECRHVFPSFFQSALQACPKCGYPSAGLPNVRIGVTQEQMATIMNWFDIYVQYSICEGFGMPQVEAAACSIPVIAVDYSAMSNVVRAIKGYPIHVQRFHRESESHSYRAYPDNEHFIQTLVKFLSMPETLRLKKSRDAYMNSRKIYTWDRAANAWEKYLDAVTIKDHKETWNSPPRMIQPNPNVPDGLTNEQFARWIIANIWGRFDKVDSYLALRLIQDLNYQQSISGTGGLYYNEDSALGSQQRYREFNRELAAQEMLNLNNVDVYWEQRRANMLKEIPRLFIRNAKKGTKE
jgi:glycosyltransferase involved in cell wall biosynthesis